MKSKNKIISELKDYVNKYGIKCFIIGISGGIDSALVYAMLNETNIKVIGVFLDIDNTKLDKECVQELEEQFNTTFLKYNLQDECNALSNKLKLSKNSMTKANLKSRLRANVLYAIANENNGLVVGTSNADELLVGYYTKFGDSACDISLLSSFTKKEIYELSKNYNLPASIISRKPTASLFEGQDDETELGVTYDEIDNFIDGIKNDPFIDKKIQTLHDKNKHKVSIVKFTK